MWPSDAKTDSLLLHYKCLAEICDDLRCGTVSGDTLMLPTLTRVSQCPPRRSACWSTCTNRGPGISWNKLRSAELSRLSHPETCAKRAPGSPWNGGHLPLCETRVSIFCCCARMTEELACGKKCVSISLLRPPTSTEIRQVTAIVRNSQNLRNGLSLLGFPMETKLLRNQ